jgi:hypothetical protein
MKAPSIATLQRLARRAMEARDKFANALELAKSQPDWERKCEVAGMDPAADAGDWQC